jgi:hypothetical protein
MARARRALLIVAAVLVSAVAAAPPCTAVQQGDTIELVAVADASHIPDAFNFTAVGCSATFSTGALRRGAGVVGWIPRAAA